MSSRSAECREWLEGDGLGGFSSGTEAGIRTRRYHALLMTATRPPTGRMVLVNGLDAAVDTPSGSFALSSQRYSPDVVHPDGASRIESFSAEPWPCWTHRADGGLAVRHEAFLHEGAMVLAWQLGKPSAGVRLRVRPFFSGRDYHSLHHENGAFRFDPEAREGCWIWRPYDGVPPIAVSANARYAHEPQWYRSFLYAEEQARGLDCVEDLAAPGVFEFDLSAGPAVLILSAGEPRFPTARFTEIQAAEEKRRAAFATPLERAADAYLVRRGRGKTIVAGYPWFTDWGRDTFIALRGLCLSTGRYEEARQILLEWAGAVSEGMLPNRFVDRDEPPEFNAVDASLWYVIGVDAFLAAAEAGRCPLPGADRRRLADAVEAILEGYSRNTRYRIHADEDGLLASGEPGVQLTWMDAKVGDWVVTPRIGKPVEVQALWLNALRAGGRFSKRWESRFERGRDSFARRFWNAERGCLYDVVDCDHQPGTADGAVRPNQILAVGGLPVALLEGERARRVVDLVEERLWTPLGPRSLDPADPAYRGRYEGGVVERDGSYHQGTVWPWLAGAFVEAWVRVRGAAPAVKAEARERFLAPLRLHLDEAGLGHVSEIADGDAPHTPRGCPFQAWSVAELLRLERDVLA